MKNVFTVGFLCLLLFSCGKTNRYRFWVRVVQEQLLWNQETFRNVIPSRPVWPYGSLSIATRIIPGDNLTLKWWALSSSTSVRPFFPGEDNSRVIVGLLSVSPLCLMCRVVHKARKAWDRLSFGSSAVFVVIQPILVYWKDRKVAPPKAGKTESLDTSAAGCTLIPSLRSHVPLVNLILRVMGMVVH